MLTERVEVHQSVTFPWLCLENFQVEEPRVALELMEQNPY